jgi:hypothetical protein
MINELADKINDKTVTVDDFNLFLEGLPKSTEERKNRRTRAQRREMTERDADPETTAKRIVKDGNNDPTKTARGKMSVQRQGEKNKKNANRFAESIEFITKNTGKPISECDFNSVSCLDDLNILVRKLLVTPNNSDSSWLHKIREHLDVR